MRTLHLAQVNIARMRGALEDQTDAGNATYLRPYDDERIIINMSVWKTVEDLRSFVYRGDHAEVLRQRGEWFEKLDAPVVALWWVPAGHKPSIDEAKKRIAHLQEHGPTPFAFTFRTPFPPDEKFAASTDWSAFEPCSAV